MGDDETLDGAPDLLCNEDGTPIALRHDLARSPADAVRRVVEGFGYEYLLEDVAGRWVDDDQRLVLDVGALRAFVRHVKPGWMRLAVTDEEREGFFGDGTWYWCDKYDPNPIVAYWDLNLE